MPVKADSLKRPFGGWRERLKGRFRRSFWRMDIHPSARIAASAYIDRTWPKGVHIGAGTIVDEDAVILTHDLTRGIYWDTRIGEGCFIGARAIIMPGVTIGPSAIVRAGSVVTKDVAEGTTVEGNPARQVPDTNAEVCNS